MKLRKHPFLVLFFLLLINPVTLLPQSSNSEYPFLRPDLNVINNSKSLQNKLISTFSDSSSEKILKIFIVGDSYTASGDFAKYLEEVLISEFGDGGKINLSLKNEFPTLLPYQPLLIKKESQSITGFELLSLADSSSIEVKDVSSKAIPFTTVNPKKGRNLKVTFPSPVESFYLGSKSNVPQKSTKGIISLTEKGVITTYFGRVAASIRTYNTELNHVFPFLEAVNPDLVIIYLGTNDCAGPNFNLSYFNVEYGNLYNRIKKAVPEASFLLVSPLTFYSYGSKGYGPNKNIKVLKEGIAALSQKEGLSYWDMSEVIGGDTIMPYWVKANLAISDYIHLTPKGQEIAAKFLAKAIIDVYRKKD